MAGWSIRQRLLALALLAVAVAWTLGSATALWSAQRANERLRDARLEQLAATILSFTGHELAEIALEQAIHPARPPAVHIETQTTLTGRYHYQLWSAAGRLLLRSAGAPAQERLAPAGTRGFADGTWQSMPSRTFTLHTDGVELTVADVGLDDDTLDLVATPGAVIAALAAAAAVGLLTAWVVVSTLRPVVRAGQVVRGRAAHDLSPIELPGLPRELAPVLQALNSLLASAAERVSRERGFTALAAHELRTPLAALRMQAQLLQRSREAAATRPAEGPAAAAPDRDGDRLAALVATVDRSSHLIEQLLTLARVDAGAAPDPHVELDWADLCDEVLADLEAALDQRQAQVQLDLQAAHVHGSRFGLTNLLRNLVANALAHSPAGGEVRIGTDLAGDRVVLRVEDSGPGIAAADRSRVLERFVRLPGGGQGAGLGLAIVAAVAEEHAARVELGESALGGLCVRVSFPREADRGDSPVHAP